MTDSPRTVTVADVLATRLAPAVPCVLAVHGSDPATGRTTTWHVTPLLGDDGAPAGCRVDRAEDGVPLLPTQRTS